MRSILKRGRPSPAMIVACVALIAAVGGSAYAANKIGTNRLKANAVTSPKIKNGAVNKADLNAAAKIRWARVNGATGGLFAQSGGISADRLIAGVYIVDFGSSVRGKGLIATVIDPSDGHDETVVHLQPCGPAAYELNFCPTNDPRFVYVKTTDLSPGPTLQDANFTIAALP